MKQTSGRFNSPSYHSRVVGLLKDASSIASTASRSSGPASRSTTVDSRLVPPIALDFRVGPAHVDRLEGVRRSGLAVQSATKAEDCDLRRERLWPPRFPMVRHRQWLR